METPKKRIGRFTRGPRPRNYQITQNVLDVLAIAAKYDTVTTSTFCRLLPHRSPKGIQLILKLLFRSSYMGRRLEQKQNPFAEVQHYLTPEGRKLLKNKGVEPHVVVADYTPQPGEPRRLHEHHLLICQVGAAIEAGAGGNLISQEELLEDIDHPDPLWFPCNISHKFPSGVEKSWKGHLRPDLYLAIKNTDKRRYYILEAERTSRPYRNNFNNSSTFRKVLGYQDIIINTKVYQKQLGIDNLRVLITASTPELLEGKMNAVRRVTDKSNLFLFNLDTIPDLYNTPWLRVGYPPIRISDNQEVIQLPTD